MTGDFDCYDAIVNFALDPRHLSLDDAPEFDVDRCLADRLGKHRPHCFMISSRLAYGSDLGAKSVESDRPHPKVPYGRNKLETEPYLRQQLGGRAKVLRLANIFGLEPGRRTFAGRALASLSKEGRNLLDISPQATRDFLPVEDFSRILTRLIPLRPGGVLNIGSGIPTRVGDMSAWFVKGFGSSSVVSVSEERRDEFCLDVGRLESLVGPVTSNTDVEASAVEVGRNLRNA